MLKVGVQSRNRLIGGPGSFLRRLVDAIVENDYAEIVSTKSLSQDVSLYSSVASRFRVKKYVVRIDGIYFDSSETNGSNRQLNKRIFDTIDAASGVIFQSEFSRRLVEGHYGKIEAPSTVILNGAPLKELKAPMNEKKVIVCSANWRTHKRLQSIVNVVTELRREVECELLVLGNIGSFIQPNLDFVKFVGAVEREKVFGYLARADLFLHLAWLDPCPNAVVEAISCGIPVVCSNEGGTPELVEATGCGRVAMCDDKVAYHKLVDLYNPPEPNITELVNEVKWTLENSDTIVNQMDRSPVDISLVARKYIEFLEDVANK